MKKLGKKAGQGATGKAASMKKADVPGEWYGGESSMDMEEGTIHPKDQVTAAFAEEHDCDRVYLVTFSAEEYEKVLPVMRHILQECGGIFCGDTEDFMPLLAE